MFSQLLYDLHRGGVWWILYLLYYLRSLAKRRVVWRVMGVDFMLMVVFWSDVGRMVE